MIEMGEKKLNRDVIKYAAVFAMLLNHMAHVFLREGSWEYEICVAVGYFTAVTMCYFLVEGYQYTRSKKKYGQRLLLFAMISQVPYQAALGIRQLNMLFTLLFCFLILVCLEYIQDSAERSVCVCLLAAATCICDWGGLAAAFTVLFAQAYGSRRKLLYAYVFTAEKEPAQAAGSRNGFFMCFIRCISLHCGSSIFHIFEDVTKIKGGKVITRGLRAADHLEAAIFF